MSPRIDDEDDEDGPFDTTEQIVNFTRLLLDIEPQEWSAREREALRNLKRELEAIVREHGQP